MFKNQQKTKYHSNINKLYLYTFFQSLIFAYVIERLFGLERGINIEQMIYIEIIYAVILMILEVPTGVLADTWGRKKTITISTIFDCLHLFILIFAFDFSFFIISTVFAAINGSLESGTKNALLYDSLKLTNDEKDFEKVLAKIRVIDAISMSIAALLGGLISNKLGYTSVYWLSVVSTFITIMISFSFYEPEIQSDNQLESDEENEKFDFREVIKFFRINGSIRFVVLYAIIFDAVITYTYEYWQIYLKEINIPVTMFGIYSVLSSVLVSGSALIAYRLKNTFNYKSIFSICVLLFGASIFVAGNITSKYGFIVFLIPFLFYGPVEPLTLGYLHHRADSKYRATIESFSSFASQIFTIITGLLFGYIATRLDIFMGLKTLGLIVLVYSIYYLIYQFKFIKEDKPVKVIDEKNT